MAITHDALFHEYVRELDDAKVAVQRWWADLLASETAITGSATVAADNLKRRWPLGPAAHPYVLFILRKYWLACEALNQVIATTATQSYDAVSPPAFLCEFLLDGKHERLALFIAPLNYWPVGIDGDV